ncbi:MAG: hypothetical protein V1742_02990 [Pseudomonadota bacterium]
MSADNKQLRLTSCVQTLIEVHTSLQVAGLDADLLRKFKQLEDSFLFIETSDITELDVCHIEQATNRLLLELKNIFETDTSGRIHEGRVH